MQIRGRWVLLLYEIAWNISRTVRCRLPQPIVLIRDRILRIIYVKSHTRYDANGISPALVRRNIHLSINSTQGCCSFSLIVWHRYGVRKLRGGFSVTLRARMYRRIEHGIQRPRDTKLTHFPVEFLEKAKVSSLNNEHALNRKIPGRETTRSNLSDLYIRRRSKHRESNFTRAPVNIHLVWHEYSRIGRV